MDLMVTEPASRIQGLQFMMRSEKGEHLQMDLVELYKVPALSSGRHQGGLSSAQNVSMQARRMHGIIHTASRRALWRAVSRSPRSSECNWKTLAAIVLRPCHQVSALALEPMGTGTWLCVDGEVVPFERIYAEVHRGLCSVICAT
jgi:hypothetical protein